MCAQKNSFTVFLVSTRETSRDALSVSLADSGFGIRVFAGVEPFLAARANLLSGCVVLEVEDDGADTLSFLARLSERSRPFAKMPVVLFAAESFSGGIAFARKAFLAGAVDVLPMGFARGDLVSAVVLAYRDAILHGARGAEQTPAVASGGPTATLTRRETEIASLLREGASNRTIGAFLGISPRTVESHKSRLMRKLQVGTKALATTRCASPPQAGRSFDYAPSRGK